jgi:hypothetical protein
LQQLATGFSTDRVPYAVRAENAIAQAHTDRLRSIPLASFTGGTQEIGGIHSERFRHGPESFEAGTKHRIIFEAPNRVRSDTNSLGKSFLRKSQLHAQPAKP